MVTSKIKKGKAVKEQVHDSHFKKYS